MEISISTKAEVVAKAPERWADQYKNWPQADKHKITARLQALPAGFSADDVDKITGNSSWTEHLCDVTDKDAEVLAVFSNDERYVTLSEEALELALNMIRKAKAAAA